MPELITANQAVRSAREPATKTAAALKGTSSRHSKGGRLSEWPYISVIVAFFLLSVAVISPAGNFPTNDDWVYGLAVKDLLQTGRFQLAGCCAASITHILLGAASCALTGFSFEPLRLVTIAMGFIGTVMLYLIARQLGVARSLSLLAALVYAANPLVINTTFSFMTDITCASLTLCYIYFFINALRSGSLTDYAVAAAFLTLSIITRQIAAVFIAINLVVLIADRRRGGGVAAVMMLVVVPALACFLSEKFHLAVDYYPENARWYSDLMKSNLKSLLKEPAQFVHDMVVQAGKAACYLGLFLTPVLVLFAPLTIKTARSKPALLLLLAFLSAVVMTVCVMQLVVTQHQTMPFSENLFRIPAMGCLSIMGINHEPLGRSGRKILTWLAVALGFVLIVVSLAAVRAIVKVLRKAVFGRDRPAAMQEPIAQSDQHRVLGLFICASALIVSIAIVILQTNVFGVDRYYVTVLPWFLLCLTASARLLRLRVLMPIAVIPLLAIMTFSLVSQQDYMGWNRARSQLLDSLMARGVDYARIDGGAEFNQFMRPDISRAQFDAEGRRVSDFRGEKPRCDWRWWPITGEEYIVSFSTIPQYDLVDSRQYFSFLSRSEKSVLLLHKASLPGAHRP